MANTLSVIRYGRYKTAPEADFGIIASGQMRGCVYDALSDNSWFDTVSSISGKNTGTNCTLGYGVYDSDSSTMDPTTREGYTGSVSVTASKTDASGGTTYSASVTKSDNGPTNTAIMGYAGKRYGISLLSTVATLCHSMRAAGSITADNEQFYDRSGLSLPAPAPYGSFSASVQGHMTAWMSGYINVAPEIPSTSISPSGSITSLTPTFIVDFKDRNGAYGASSGLGIDSGDRMKTYRMRVQRVSDGFYMWSQTITATASEIAANQINIAYGGSALSRGVQYQWRVQVADQFGEYSDWMAWTAFTPTSLGYITLDSTPNGKIEAISGSPTLDFNGRWNHQSATTMKRVQVFLYDQNGTLLQTGADYDIADVASSALPGTLFTVTWPNSGFSSISWGRTYQYGMKGYDGTNWSELSSLRSFNTNAAPTVPSTLSPSGGTPWTSLPLLTCSFSDADDTTGTGLTGVFRITRPDTSTVDVTPTYNATTGLWQFQTTVTELTAFGTYSWKATGYDGTIYSGEQALLANASWSASATFTYSNGPTVTVSSPTNNSTLTSDSFTITWTSSGTQQSFQITIYADNDSNTIIYQSPVTVTSVQSYTIPSGYLHNSTNYDIIVKVTDTTPLDGFSQIINIYLSYATPSTPTGLQITPIKISDDPWETAFRLTWDQTPYSSPVFHEYLLYRWADDGPDKDQVILRRFKSPSTTAFTDHIPASGYEYTYALATVILSGTDYITSSLTSATGTINLQGVVLSLVGNGGTYRVCLTNVTERSFNRQISEQTYQNLKDSEPVTIRNKIHYWESTMTGYLVDTTNSDAKDKYDAIVELDAQDGVVCVRDGRGRKRFCKITDLSITDQLPDFYQFSMKVRQEKTTEGSG